MTETVYLQAPSNPRSQGIDEEFFNIVEALGVAHMDSSGWKGQAVEVVSEDGDCLGTFVWYPAINYQLLTEEDAPNE